MMAIRAVIDANVLVGACLGTGAAASAVRTAYEVKCSR